MSKAEKVVWTEDPDGVRRFFFSLKMSFSELEIKSNANKGSECGQNRVSELGL
jgi:hypothetical protein